jgi:4'-phosphopantetheinyl transferase
VPNMATWLSPDEQARAARFAFAPLRQRFTAGRAVLRWLLGAYLGIDPATLTFSYGERGKPALEPGPWPHDLAFNLAHSDDVALFALARGGRVGVDVERIRGDVADAQLAERYFSKREAAELAALSSDQRERAFFQAWTRKEAYLKATGEGLAMPLDQFEVSMDPRAPAALLSINGSASQAARWSLHALHPAPDYAAALVVEGRDWHLTCWDVPSDLIYPVSAL